MLRALPAFLLEATFFLALGSNGLREALAKRRGSSAAMLLVAMAVAPYALAAIAFHNFNWHALAWIAGLAAISAFWYVLLPHKPASDLFFLAVVAVVALSRILRSQYPSPDPRLPLDFLGQAMWIRTGAFAMLCVRQVQG